jgi:50S ribosomal protein L16 3-hydroxylase
VLSEWLHPTSIADFEAKFLHRSAYSQPAAAQGAMTLFDWHAVDRLLASNPLPDALVVAGGRVHDVAMPRSAGELRTMMTRGLGVNVRHAEHNSAGLAALAAAFRRCLGGEVQIQVFATAARTHSFGWHYDDEDVFIAQTAGIKDYYFRRNTVTALRAKDIHEEEPPDFSRIAEEKSALQTARLIPGDWLYVPRRWWHVALCVEESLSISVGVRLRPAAQQSGS